LVNPPNLQLKSWNRDNSIKNKVKKDYEAQSWMNLMLYDEIDNKINYKKGPKKDWSQPGLACNYIFDNNLYSLWNCGCYMLLMYSASA
jgi:hypothetical protein